MLQFVGDTTGSQNMRGLHVSYQGNNWSGVFFFQKEAKQCWQELQSWRATFKATLLSLLNKVIPRISALNVQYNELNNFVQRSGIMYLMYTFTHSSQSELGGGGGVWGLSATGQIAWFNCQVYFSGCGQLAVINSQNSQNPSPIGFYWLCGFYAPEARMIKDNRSRGTE